MPTQEYVEDRIFWPMVAKLSECLCAELEKSGLGGLCFCGVLFGDQVIPDFPVSGQCSGQAWVRLASVFPSMQSFPDPDGIATCATVLAATLEVGVTRSAPQGNGRMLPTTADWAHTTSMALADMAAMRRAIACCFRSVDMVYSLGTYEPSYQGDIVLGTWQLTVQQTI